MQVKREQEILLKIPFIYINGIHGNQILNNSWQISEYMNNPNKQPFLDLAKSSHQITYQFVKSTNYCKWMLTLR